ncbi:hypothetical protein EV200_101211 [Pedobacter psychrotolerans]|uniref:Uncharacterized protein n=1 Tax=Pedobacter psychrotolerans TaxID=1843235 RepID=A0A4R2HMC9_9SPHI|nr:hypothetical protein EV200_101211 [Pedobacter psychrotolerans]
MTDFYISSLRVGFFAYEAIYFNESNCFTPLQKPYPSVRNDGFSYSKRYIQTDEVVPATPFHRKFVSRMINLRSFKGQERGRTSPVLNKAMLMTDFYISSTRVGFFAYEAIYFNESNCFTPLLSPTLQFAMTDFHIPNATFRLTKFPLRTIPPKLRKSNDQLAKFQRPRA